MVPLSEDERASELLKILVELKVISGAQASLVEGDHSSTGMAIEDILMARGWVKQEHLDKHAPWLADDNNHSMDTKSSASFQENLRKYRSLLAAMLGESSE